MSYIESRTQVAGVKAQIDCSLNSHCFTRRLLTYPR